DGRLSRRIARVPRLSTAADPGEEREMTQRETAPARWIERAREPRRPIALLLPGQGAQYPGMAIGLYGWEPGFTEAMDEVFALLGTRSGRIQADWLSGRPAIPVHDAQRAQPLLFAIG